MNRAGFELRIADCGFALLEFTSRINKQSIRFQSAICNPQSKMRRASPVKRIGVLTGGGDAPGLNAVIRAVVKTATNVYGWTVIGIENGFEGLLGETHTRPLGYDDVRGLLP